MAFRGGIVRQLGTLLLVWGDKVWKAYSTILHQIYFELEGQNMCDIIEKGVCRMANGNSHSHSFTVLHSPENSATVKKFKNEEMLLFIELSKKYWSKYLNEKSPHRWRLISHLTDSPKLQSLQSSADPSSQYHSQQFRSSNVSCLLCHSRFVPQVVR